MNFPDVEQMFRDFLLDQMSGAVVIEIQNPRPGEFLRVWRSGGGALNRVLERPIITVESWADDFTTAHDRLQEARTVLLNAGPALPLVRRMEEVSGPYRDPDPDSNTPRYSMSLRPTVRSHRTPATP